MSHQRKTIDAAGYDSDRLMTASNQCHQHHRRGHTQQKRQRVREEIGMLKLGMHADMLLWDIENPAELACQFGVNSIVQRIFAGEVSNVATR